MFATRLYLSSATNQRQYMSLVLVPTHWMNWPCSQPPTSWAKCSISNRIPMSVSVASVAYKPGANCAAVAPLLGVSIWFCRGNIAGLCSMSFQIVYKTPPPAVAAAAAAVGLISSKYYQRSSCVFSRINIAQWIKTAVFTQKSVFIRSANERLETVRLSRAQ